MKIAGSRIFLILLILGVLIFILDSKEKINFLVTPISKVFIPFQIATLKVKNDLYQFAQVITNAQNLRRGVSVLEEENATLLAENALLKTTEEENSVLRAQLGIKELANKKLIIAKVIGFSPLATKKYLVIDKGEEEGVAQGDLVIVKNIFIGKIAKSSPKKSLVGLPLDPDSKIPAKTNRGAKGILTGEFQTQLLLKEVLHEETLQEGDLVLTTGEGDLEANLVLGEVKDVFKNEKELFQEAKVKPLLDLSKLETVFILKE